MLNLTNNINNINSVNKLNKNYQNDEENTLNISQNSSLLNSPFSYENCDNNLNTNSNSNSNLNLNHNIKYYGSDSNMYNHASSKILNYDENAYDAINYSNSEKFKLNKSVKFKKSNINNIIDSNTNIATTMTKIKLKCNEYNICDICRNYPSINFILKLFMIVFLLAFFPFLIQNTHNLFNGINSYLNNYDPVFGGFGCHYKTYAITKNYVENEHCVNKHQNNVNLILEYNLHEYFGESQQCIFENNKCIDKNNYPLNMNMSIYTCHNQIYYDNDIDNCVNIYSSNMKARNGVYLVFKFIVTVVMYTAMIYVYFLFE